MPGSVVMLPATSGTLPAPTGYAFAGTIVVLKSGTLIPSALYTKK